MKRITTCLTALGVAICTGCARGTYEIKVKGEGIRPIIATTNTTSFGGVHWESGEDKGDYQVTAQIVGANVVVVERLVVSLHGTNSESVIITNIPVNSLPRTFALSQTLPTSGCPAEHARVTVLKVEPRIRDKELPEKSIMVGDDYAASVHRIIAAGGTERFIPEAPVKTAPEPVVDDKGHTNWVSHYLPRPQLFEMKDGRVITVVSTTGKKVARIDVQPPRETND